MHMTYFCFHINIDFIAVPDRADSGLSSVRASDVMTFNQLLMEAL